MNPRYDGKPLLRLIELYVIDAIGELQPSDAENLKSMTPKLQELYKTEGDWRAAISKAMAFPDTMPDAIRGMWTKNQDLARQNGEILKPEDFAMMFVDANIPQN
ncbi:MAG: hypothetical protein KDM64_14895 [Verrucomicrobiae bacterium]|nr:hypothetical protein [Verrucomicrobiae bacterium]